MKTIRNNVFETNSSSCHSITFNNVLSPNFENVKKLYFSCDEYFYGGDVTVDDAETKALYYSVALASYIKMKLEDYKRDFFLKNFESRFDYFKNFGSDYGVNYQNELKTISKKDFKKNYYNFSWVLVYPPEVIKKGQKLLNKIKKKLDNYFNEKGVEIVWTDRNNQNKDWTILTDEGVKSTECIDHQSSASESPECVIFVEFYKTPEKVYNWILNKNCSVFLSGC